MVVAQPIVQSNDIRIGKPSSSKAYLLMQDSRTKDPFSTQGMKYIKKKAVELVLQKTSEIEFFSRQTAWGDFVELYVFYKLLTSEWTYLAQNTQEHQTIKGWVGTPDYLRKAKKIVSDCKGYYPEKFLQYTACLKKNDIALFKKEYKEEYWQLVSNACIMGYKIIEPITFLPKRKTISKLQEFVDDMQPVDKIKYEFIFNDGQYEDYRLPHMHDDCKVKELNIFQFEVPQEDIDKCTERFKLAIKEVNKYAKEYAA